MTGIKEVALDVSEIFSSFAGSFFFFLNDPGVAVGHVSVLLRRPPK